MKIIGAAVAATARALARVVGEGQLDRRISELEQRLAALERAPFRYCGTFKANMVYMAGTFVTHGGSLWHCNADGTTSRPGDGPAWTLAVKHGKDGR